MQLINLKYSVYVFLLIGACAIVPGFKLLSAIACLLTIFTANPYKIFFAFTWIHYLAYLNPELIGFSDSLDNLLRILVLIFSFLIIFIKYKKGGETNSIFNINSYMCLIFFFITLVHYSNNLFFLAFLKLCLYYFGSSFSILIYSFIKKFKPIYSWMFALLANSIFYSLAIYLFAPNIAFLENNPTLFQGALIHPNRFGAFFLPFLVILLSKITHEKKPNLLNFTFIFLIIILFFLSGSRGTFASLFIASAITLVIAWFNKNNFKYEIILILKKIFFPTAILLLFSFATGFFDLSNLNDFLIKSGNEGQSIKNLFLRSRGWRIFISYQAFLDHIWFGIGFGLPTPENYMEGFEVIYSGLDFFKITYDPIFGLPISAPAEKSFFFIAILEELGVFGSVTFLAFFLKWSRVVSIRSNTVFNILLFFTIFSSSIFEFSWFSMGSFSLSWIWLGFVNNSISKNKT